MHSSELKILQIVGNMDSCGGVQQGLMHIFRSAKSYHQQMKMDFLLDSFYIGNLENEIRTLGGEIFKVDFRNPLKILKKLQLLNKFNKYDIVHSHCGLRNGLYALFCNIVKVRSVIVHSHSSFETDGISLTRSLYNSFMRILIRRFSDFGFAVSDKAFEIMFGQNNSRRFSIMPFPCFDKAKFEKSNDNLRNNLGIDSEELIVGFVGRLEKEKNLIFLLDIAREIQLRKPNSTLAIIGVGSQLEELRRYASENQIRVLFLGQRNDVPQLFQSLVDVFVLPSKYEGMPLTLIEAQGCGLCCFVSANISSFGFVIPELVFPLSILSRPSEWAKAILEKYEKRIEPNRALKILDESVFSVKNASNELFSFYYSLKKSNCSRG